MMMPNTTREVAFLVGALEELSKQERSSVSGFLRQCAQERRKTELMKHINKNFLLLNEAQWVSQSLQQLTVCLHCLVAVRTHTR
jgi:hypothetical protein